MPKAKQITLSNGTTYESLSALLKDFNLSYPTYYQYMKKLDGDIEAVLKKSTSIRRGPYVDHLGNKFKTLTQMAKYHHINPSTLFSRMQEHPLDGFTQWLRPTRKMKSHVRSNFVEVTDSHGRRFDSIQQAADFHKISNLSVVWLVNTGRCETYAEAIDRLVEKKLAKEPIVDADGRKFDSIAQACRFHGLSTATYHRRRELHPDWTVAMLLGEYKKGNTKAVIDHEGRGFESVNRMCEFHCLPYNTYQKRRKAHPDWPMSKLLAKPRKAKN